jgi:hypothetical protein
LFEKSHWLNLLLSWSRNLVNKFKRICYWRWVNLRSVSYYLESNKRG